MPDIRTTAWLAALAAATGAWASQGPAPPRVITHPQWVREPSLGDVLSVYRTQRLPTWKGGSAAIRCRITARGELTACVVAREEPYGAGLGTAALKLAPIFRMRTADRDGQPVAGAQVTLPIEFAPVDSSTATRLPH